MIAKELVTNLTNIARIFTPRERKMQLVVWASEQMLFGAQMFVPFVLGKIFDSLAHKDSHTAFRYLAFMAIINLGIVFTAELTKRLVRERTLMSFVRTNQMYVFRKAAALSLGIHQTRGVAEIFSTLEKGLTGIDQIIHAFWFTLTRVILRLVFSFAALLLVAPPLGATLFAFFIVSCLGYSRVIVRWMGAEERLHAKWRNFHHYYKECLKKLEDILVHAGVQRVANNLEDRYEDFRIADYVLWSWIIKVETVLDGLLMPAGVLTMIALGIWRVESGLMTVGTLIATVTWGNVILNEIVQGNDSMRNVLRQLPYTDRLFSFLHQKNPLEENGCGRLIPANPQIELDDINFAYNGDAPIFKGCSCVLTHASIVGVVGRSGGGKTTLARLLTRAYDVSHGRITLGDVDIRDLSFADLRTAITIAPQESKPWDGTLRENLLNLIARREQAADGLLLEILARCDLDVAGEMASVFTKGLDTLIGEDGLELSVGQRQRLWNARAVLRAICDGSSWILLDEPTAALDAKGEQKVSALFTWLRDTHGLGVIVIAHRLSTLAECDQLLVVKPHGLENGEQVWGDAQADRQIESWQSMTAAEKGSSTFRHLLEIQRDGLLLGTISE